MLRGLLSIIMIGDSMKKYFVFFLLCFFVPISVHAKTVVALGDSITTGYGVDERESYASLFCNELGRKTNENVVCENFSVNGFTSNQLLGKIKEDEVVEAIKKSDYILMSIGGNDFLQELTSNLSTYLSVQKDYPKVGSIGNNLVTNLTFILDDITRINPHVQILLVPLYNPYVVFFKANLALMNSFNDVKNVYNETAKNYPQVFLDSSLTKTLEREEYLNVSLSDRIIDPHPNRLGHNAIARTFTQQIKETEEIKITKNKNSWIPIVVITGILVLLFGMWKWLFN